MLHGTRVPCNFFFFLSFLPITWFSKNWVFHWNSIFRKSSLKWGHMAKYFQNKGVLLLCFEQMGQMSILAIFFKYCSTQKFFGFKKNEILTCSINNLGFTKILGLIVFYICIPILWWKEEWLWAGIIIVKNI